MRRYRDNTWWGYQLFNGTPIACRHINDDEVARMKRDPFAEYVVDRFNADTKEEAMLTIEAKIRAKSRRP